MSKKSPNPIDVHVGSRVRSRRIMLGMSQEKLGKGLGITFQQVQKYEKGTNRIGASRLQQISKILQAPVAFFFEGAPGIEARAALDIVDPLAELGQTRQGLLLAAAFNSITDPRVRGHIVALVELYAENIAAHGAKRKAAA